MIAAIDPAKDVDGFHPMNAGRLAAGQHGLVPCTPKGVMQLLREAGARWPVPGRWCSAAARSSAGRWLQLLLAADCTVTVAHSRTRDLPPNAAGRRSWSPPSAGRRWCAATGSPPGATVIDVGINRRRTGKLVGDVAFAEALPRSPARSPRCRAGSGR